MAERPTVSHLTGFSFQLKSGRTSAPRLPQTVQVNLQETATEGALLRGGQAAWATRSPEPRPSPSFARSSSWRAQRPSAEPCAPWVGADLPLNFHPLAIRV